MNKFRQIVQKFQEHKEVAFQHSSNFHQLPASPTIVINFPISIFPKSRTSPQKQPPLGVSSIPLVQSQSFSQSVHSGALVNNYTALMSPFHIKLLFLAVPPGFNYNKSCLTISDNVSDSLNSICQFLIRLFKLFLTLFITFLSRLFHFKFRSLHHFSPSANCS